MSDPPKNYNALLPLLMDPTQSKTATWNRPMHWRRYPAIPPASNNKHLSHSPCPSLSVPLSLSISLPFSVSLLLPFSLSVGLSDSLSLSLFFSLCLSLSIFFHVWCPLLFKTQGWICLLDATRARAKTRRWGRTEKTNWVQVSVSAPWFCFVFGWLVRNVVKHAFQATTSKHSNQNLWVRETLARECMKLWFGAQHRTIVRQSCHNIQPPNSGFCQRDERRMRRSLKCGIGLRRTPEGSPEISWVFVGFRGLSVNPILFRGQWKPQLFQPFLFLRGTPTPPRLQPFFISGESLKFCGVSRGISRVRWVRPLATFSHCQASFLWYVWLQTRFHTRNRFLWQHQVD